MEGKGLCPPVCPAEPSALGCAGHGQQVAPGVVPWLLLGSAELSVGNKSHGKLQKGSGEGRGSQSQLALSRWHQAW